MSDTPEPTTEDPPVPATVNPNATRGAANLPLNQAPFTFKTLQAIANTEFVPKGLRGKPSAILACILTGRELGLGPMEALRSIDVIDGRPSPSAEWMVGRIFEAGHILELVTQTAEVCTVRGTRIIEGREPITMEFSFTLDMAKRANLVGKDNWKKYPEAMLYWRAIAQLARQFFPDVLHGIKHLPEEIGAADWDAYGVIPEEGDLLPAEEAITDEDGELIVDGDIEDAVLLEEDDEGWENEPTPTGEADRVAIERVLRHGEGEASTLWVELFNTIDSYEAWTATRKEDIEAEVRFIFRAMEFLGVWQSENALREELRRQSIEHLTEMTKPAMVSFARNMVMKAGTATRARRETT